MTPLSAEGDGPAVGDGDGVSVAGEIGKHRLRHGEGTLGVEDPFDLARGRQIRGKGTAVGERAWLAKKREATGLMRRHERLQEEPAAQAGEHAHGQEEARPA